MTAFVDTNVLVRHLTGNPRAMARRASAFLASAADLLLADLVAAETVYVLDSFYGFDRHQVADALRALVALTSIRVPDAAVLLRAIEVYEVDRLDFAEAYLVACAESTGVNAIVSFDTSLDRVGTVDRVQP